MRISYSWIICFIVFYTFEYICKHCPSDEEGCLAFKKGALISVIRRVDQNWAEGRIDDTIGIFPIAFVEMNSLAMQIIEASAMNYPSLSQRNIPPTPTNEQQPIHFSNASKAMTTTLMTTSTNNDLMKNTQSKLNLTQFLNASSDHTRKNTSDSSNLSSTHNSNKINSIRHSSKDSSPLNVKAKESPAQKHSKSSQHYMSKSCGINRSDNQNQKSGVFPGNYVKPLHNTYANTSSLSTQHLKRSEGSNYENSSNLSGSNVNPPVLPPRSGGSSPSSAWSKPIGQQMEALFGRSQSVNLIKRITNIKKSKFPINNHCTPSYSMDNPVFEDNSVGCSEAFGTTTTSKRNIVHLRSGSCPSQLLQMNLGATKAGGVINKADMFSSHRIKPPKERTTLNGITYEFSGTTNHRKSQSLDATQISSNSKKSYTHNEKFKCIVAYPPNSDFELELAPGDLVFVHKKRENGWYKGTHAYTGRCGLFPSSFVEPVI